MIPPDDGSSSGGEPSSALGSQTDTSREGDVHAFLIADIRGYTAFTHERGDEDAGRLAGRFAQVTRSVVEEHRGHVLELRGDEALVVFGSPRSAIRGAVALQQRFVEETIADPSLPLTVGIGLDAGEAVAVEGGYRGGALNVAARLCSLARAGEVLASREIVHLALRVDGVRFTERGQAALKGLEKPVHVVAVRSEERDDALAIAPFVRSPSPRTRWKAVAAVVAFVVVAALVAIPLVARRAGGSSEIEPNSVGVLDPESGDVTATVGLENRPGSVAASADAIWVTNPDVGTVTRIDPNEQEIRDSILVGENPTGIAVGFDAVWVVNSGGKSVSRISPDTAVAEVRGVIIIGTPKTHASRSVVLPGFLAPILGEYLARVGRSGLVFPDAAGGPLRVTNWNQRRFTPTARLVGLIPPRLRVHDMRHTAASLMISSGAGVKVVQQQLGHRSSMLTLDRYAHLFPDELDALSSALDGLKARTPADSSRTVAGSGTVGRLTT
jgi:class 3 adenylate cyclase